MYSLCFDMRVETSIPVVSLGVLYRVQAVYQHLSWTGFHLPSSQNTCCFQNKTELEYDCKGIELIFNKSEALFQSLHYDRRVSYCAVMSNLTSRSSHSASNTAAMTPCIIKKQEGSWWIINLLITDHCRVGLSAAASRKDKLTRPNAGEMR